MKNRCISSLALVYHKARWRSTCTTTSASLELQEDCSRMSSKVVSRNRVLMTVEDNYSVSAASRYRRHGGPGRCRSGRHSRLGATCGSVSPSRGSVVLTCLRTARRTHLVSAVEFAWVSSQRRSWRVGATSQKCGFSRGVTATTPLTWFHMLRLVGLGGHWVAPSTGGTTYAWRRQKPAPHRILLRSRPVPSGRRGTAKFRPPPASGRGPY